MNEAEALAELRARLTQAVRSRLISDVPLGAFSAAASIRSVVALMAELSTSAVKNLLYWFRGEGIRRTALRPLVAKRYGTDHHEFVVRPNAMELLPRSWALQRTFRGFFGGPDIRFSRN